MFSPSDSTFRELLTAISNNKSLPNMEHLYIPPVQDEPRILEFGIMLPNNGRAIFAIFYHDNSAWYQGEPFTYGDYTFIDRHYSGEDALKAIAIMQTYLEDLASRK